jgi:hypothetical protein
MASNRTYRLLGLLFLALLLASTAGCTQPQRQSTVFGGKRPGFRASPGFETRVFPEGELSAETNVHFNARYCLACHTEVPAGRTGEKYLRYGGDYRRLCRCHYPEEGPIHTHPTAVQPTVEGNLSVPAAFPLEDGKTSCLTCHDVYIQCRNSESDRLLLKGQMFLRGQPYDKRIDFCYRCHDEGRYQKFNPHRQLDEQGNVIETRCLYCHAEAPDVRQTTWEDVKLIGSFTKLCLGCHFQAAKQALHARHLRRPDEAIRARMQALQTEFNIVLPLDHEGKVTCATCHNPHQKGLIPDQRAGARGAGAVHRHRIQENLCIKCHDMQSLDAFSPAERSFK